MSCSCGNPNCDWDMRAKEYELKHRYQLERQQVYNQNYVMPKNYARKYKDWSLKDEWLTTPVPQVKKSEKEEKLVSHINDVVKHLRDYCITLQSVADTTLSRGEKRAADDRKIQVTKLADDLDKLKS